MKRSCIALALAVCLAVSSSAATVTLMTYNVENLFDDVRDGTEYREFDPGTGKWNAEFFKVRIETIGEVVRKAIAGGPDILLLQEVENENTLKALVQQGFKGMGYAAQVLVPKKKLSANVAIVSRLAITRVRSHAVPPWRGDTPVRDIIEAEIQVSGHTLYVLNNHWKSKTEGVKATEASRREAASVLARRIREILTQDPAADIIAAGDMNESIDEYGRVGGRYQTALLPENQNVPKLIADRSIFLSANIRGLEARGERCMLYDPWYEIEESRRGSYFYQGEWLTVDHMLLSAGLFDMNGFSYQRESFAPVRLPFLLTAKGAPRKWTGLAGDRGYSDHLPLLLTLNVRK
ncbi:MAG: endonuclease/exonuclease/phosphatase family protein [Spirochaetia bacterium]|jgi:endonuclease/exonuclease/phosphatase family metal-dependent hydrolase